MLSWFYRRRKHQGAIDEAVWHSITASEPSLHALEPTAYTGLLALTHRLLASKRFIGAGGHEPTAYQCAHIAAVAALPVLRLGLSWYCRWKTVIIYPDAFVVPYTEMDSDGVVHEGTEARAGEAHDDGPVVLSWADIGRPLDPGSDGYNLVIHEMAHQIDALSGTSNGMPPLHRGMVADAWVRAFSACFRDLEARALNGEATPIDAYAAESPAECFAVASEAFFQTPHRLTASYPGVYDQLRRFYGQNPAGRQAPGGGEY